MNTFVDDCWRTLKDGLTAMDDKRGWRLTVPQMDVVGRTIEHEYPDQNRGTGLRLLALSPIPGNSGPIVAFLGLLTLIVSIVLIVTCANVAGVV